MIRRQEPLTEAERCLLADGKLLVKELARLFDCSTTTVRRAQEAVREGLTAVYLFKPVKQPARRALYRKHFLKSDEATAKDMEQGPIGHDPIGACNAHLEDLIRVYGPRARI